MQSLYNCCVSPTCAVQWLRRLTPVLERVNTQNSSFSGSTSGTWGRTCTHMQTHQATSANGVLATTRHTTHTLHNCNCCRCAAGAWSLRASAVCQMLHCFSTAGGHTHHLSARCHGCTHTATLTLGTHLHRDSSTGQQVHQHSGAAQPAGFSIPEVLPHTESTTYLDSACPALAAAAAAAQRHRPHHQPAIAPHTAVSGLASGRLWPIECCVLFSYLLLDCVLERVRHEALPWLSAVAILGMW